MTRIARGSTMAAMVVTTLAALFSTPHADAEPITTTATVLRIVDGDTIDVIDDNRGRLRIRILGIDTPETKKPGYTIGCWGPEASRFAQDSLAGQRVALRTDSTQDLTDKYGRTLAYVIKADGWDYSVESVRAGAAKSYVYKHSPDTEYSLIEAAQSEAMSAGRGLWGSPCFGATSSVPN